MQANIAKLDSDRSKVQEVYATSSGALLVQSLGVPASSVTMVAASSGNVANASAAASISAVAAKTNYVTGFTITASGATAASVQTATLAGLVGGVTLSYTFVFPAGATTVATPLIVTFPTPIPANAANTAITVTLPAGGAGNTNAAVTIHGFRV